VQTGVSFFELIFLGIAKLNFIHPLTVMFSKKEDVLALTRAYNEANKRGIVFPEGVQVAKDKTVLQWHMLRQCHLEL